MSTQIAMNAQILDGNLGSGWKNPYNVALRYSQALEAEFRRHALAAFPGADVIVDIDVKRNASGATRAPSVRVVVGGALEYSPELDRSIEEAVNQTWAVWVNSAEAAMHAD